MTATLLIEEGGEIRTETFKFNNPPPEVGDKLTIGKKVPLWDRKE